MEPTKPKVNPLGTWTLLGTWLTLIAVSLYDGAYPQVLRDLANLYGGHVNEVPRYVAPVADSFPVMVAVITLALPAAALLAWLATVIVGKSSSFTDLFSKSGHQHWFMIVFLIVTAEEVYARGIFLGLLWDVAFDRNPTWFYVLLLVGNGTWALAHLSNYKRASDRHPMRVVSQFATGLFLSYVFVKYGFFAVLLGHFAFDMVAFSAHKLQKMNRFDWLIAGYNLVSAVAGYAILTRPLSDLQLWLGDNPTFALPGWDQRDYLGLFLLVGGVVGFVLEVLIFDRAHQESKVTTEQALLITPVVTLLMLGLFWLAGLVVHPVGLRLVLISVLMCFALTSSSGSALARTFWGALVGQGVVFCIVLATGFWTATVLLILLTVIDLPERWLRDQDAELDPLPKAA